MAEVQRDSRGAAGFADFYGARRDAVFRAVLVAVGDRAVAEDAVAEGFARAYARWRSVAAHPNPTAWVLRTALNAQRSWWRRSRREVSTTPPERPSADEPGRLPGELMGAVTGRRAGRAPLLAATATATAVAAAVAVVLAVGGAVDPQPGPFPSGGSAAATGSGTASPATDHAADERRCAADYDARHAQHGDPALPPLRFALTAADPRLRLLLFADERHIMACSVNHEMVEVPGSSGMVIGVKDDDTPFAIGGFKLLVGGVEFAGVYGLGQAPAGTTAVEIRFAGGDAVPAELSDGWWGWLGGEQYISRATEVVITTPAGITTHPVTWG